MTFDRKYCDYMCDFASDKLSEYFCRKIDVAAVPMNGGWVFTARFEPSCYHKEFFKPEKHPNKYEWSLKFIEEAIKCEKRRIRDMNYCHEHETAVTERQKEYLNILYSMFDSFANEKKYAFDSETDVERGFVKFIFRNRQGRCYRHVININDTRHTNLYPLVHDITVEVDRLLSEDSGKSVAEYYCQDIEFMKSVEEQLSSVSKKSVAYGWSITDSRIEYDIKDVIFKDPATIVFWKDGTKTVVKAIDEEYDPEKGLAMAIAKKRYGNKWSYYNVFKHWLKKYKKPEWRKING